MIIYKGYGGIVFYLTLGIFICINFGLSAIFGHEFSRKYLLYQTIATLLLSGFIIWREGRRLNNLAGQVNHSFYFVPMELWGITFFFLAGLLMLKILFGVSYLLGYITLVLAIPALFWFGQKRDLSSPKMGPKAGTLSSPQPSGKGSMTTQALLDEVIALRKRNAQWGEILMALNPTRDPKILDILYAIRGPHMLVPHTALEVIESGCRSVHPAATALSALNAALESMNKVVRFGD